MEPPKLACSAATFRLSHCEAKTGSVQVETFRVMEQVNEKLNGLAVDGICFLRHFADGWLRRFQAQPLAMIGR